MKTQCLFTTQREHSVRYRVKTYTTRKDQQIRGFAPHGGRSFLQAILHLKTHHNDGISISCAYLVLVGF